MLRRRMLSRSSPAASVDGGRSPFLRSVEIALREKGLDYRLHALKPGEHKQPDYLARHPFGRVPAFEHDGFAIYETQAIIRYLDEVFPNPPLTASELAREAGVTPQRGPGSSGPQPIALLAKPVPIAPREDERVSAGSPTS